MENRKYLVNDELEKPIDNLNDFVSELWSLWKNHEKKTKKGQNSI